MFLTMLADEDERTSQLPGRVVRDFTNFGELVGRDGEGACELKNVPALLLACG